MASLTLSWNMNVQTHLSLTPPVHLVCMVTEGILKHSLLGGASILKLTFFQTAASSGQKKKKRVD